MENYTHILDLVTKLYATFDIILSYCIGYVRLGWVSTSYFRTFGLGYELNKQDVKKHLSLFIVYRIPTYTINSKSILTLI